MFILNYLWRPVRAISSVGSEHLVYTEGVGSSSLSSPTKKKPTQLSGFLFIHYDKLIIIQIIVCKIYEHPNSLVLEISCHLSF